MFDDLTLEELQAKIVEIRNALERVSAGGDVQVIWAEGRRLEYTRGNAGELRNLLNTAKSELRRRQGNGVSGSAIGVRIY